MNTDYIEVRLPEGSNLTSRPMTDITQRQLLCKDLEVLCTQDSTILEEVIDEYVYLLDARRIEEMQEFVNKELATDY